MANLYMDLFETCPLIPVPSSGNQEPLPANVAAMNRLSFIASRSSGAVHSARQGIIPSPLSNKALALQVGTTSIVTTRSLSSAYVTVSNNPDKIFIGAAMRFSPINSGLDYFSRPIIGINSAVTTEPPSGLPGRTTTWFNQTALLLRENGTVSFGGAFSADNVFPVNTHKYVELSFEANTGNVEVYIDDALVLSTSVDPATIIAAGVLAGTGENSPSSLAFSYLLEVDNLYINDDTGSHFNGRMGPIAVQWAPLKAEDSVTWIPEGSPNNITAVNRNDLDTAAFVRSPSLNNQADLYEVDTDVIDPNKQILGVLAAPYFRKTDIGARNLAAVATDGVNKLERTFTDASLDFAGSTTPLLMPAAPQGGAWDIAKIAACKFGYEVKA